MSDYHKRCYNPFKTHRRPILKSLVQITPYLDQKYNLNRSTQACLKKISLLEKSPKDNTGGAFQMTKSELRSEIAYGVSSQEDPGVSCPVAVLESRTKSKDSSSMQEELSSSKLMQDVAIQCCLSNYKFEEKEIQCNIPGRSVETQCSFSHPEVVEEEIQCMISGKSVETQFSPNTPNTPRKIRLRKDVHRKSCHIRYLKKRNNFLESKLRMMKSGSSNAAGHKVNKYLKEHLPMFLFEVVKTQLSGKQRWSLPMKNLCLTIYLKSPRAYKFLRTFMKLPSTDTLIRFLNLASVRPGFDHQLNNCIKNAVININDSDKFVILLMDEINLKKNLLNLKSDCIVGLEDLGYGQRTSNPATSALCFMIRSVSGNWKQLVGYVFSSGPVRVNDLQSLMFRCISKLYEIGLKVICITTDQAGNFSLLFKNFGVTKSKPHFQFGNNKIFVIPDVPHLLKSTRNAIFSNYVSTNEGIVQWNHIKDAYNINVQRNFSYMPKIKEAHINLSPFGGKMKVKLAAQILSRSVNIALLKMRQEGLIDEESIATAQFCANINNLFDVLNSSPSQKGRTPYHDELRVGSPGWLFLSEMKAWIEGWKIFRDFDGQKMITSRFRFVGGWIQAINGVQMLLQELSTFNFQYIYTRRLCQDPLENCFGDIRGSGGWSDNPTCSQFESLFKRAAVNSLIKISTLKNCEDDDSHNLLTSDLISINDSNLNDSCSGLLISESDICFPSTRLGDISELNGMRYVCGALAKKNTIVS